MRRIVALAALFLALAGCDTQSIGGRCESNIDCDRNPIATATALCMSYVNPGRACSGLDCICCPVDPVAAANVMMGTVHVCVGTPVTDAGGSDVQDSAVEASTDVVEAGADVVADAAEGGTCPMSCGAGLICQDGACRPALNIGQTCTGDSQCATTHCVTGVCCNSACTCAGCSCATSPDFAGLCMRAPTDAGAAD